MQVRQVTRTTNARIAGSTFLLYIATGIVIMILSGQANGGPGTAGKLVGIAHHLLQVRLNIVLGLLSILYALVLGATLCSLTRDIDADLALLALCCRAGEGVVGAISTLATLGLMSLSTSAAGASSASPSITTALAEFLFRIQGWNTVIAATFFAAGSTLFCWLFLRGRLIPRPLAWLGVAASLLLVICLPLQLAGFLSGPITMLVWLPMALFEIPLGFWLIVKGVGAPAPAPAERTDAPQPALAATIRR